MKVKLGCPRYCAGFVCVDSRPTDDRLLPFDVYAWLQEQRVVKEKEGKTTIEYLYSKNLLEHLPNVGQFLALCHDVIDDDGILEVITDNAIWPLFYVPIPKSISNLRPDGIFSLGAHMNSYPKAHGNHYAVFTTKHLKNYFEDAGFELLGCYYGIHSEVRNFRINLHFPIAPRIKVLGRKIAR
jgi:hypothetical protein